MNILQKEKTIVFPIKIFILDRDAYFYYDKVGDSNLLLWKKINDFFIKQIFF